MELQEVLANEALLTQVIRNQVKDYEERMNARLGRLVDPWDDDDEDDDEELDLEII